jgi:ribosome-interacting GTPase 1
LITKPWTIIINSMPANLTPDFRLAEEKFKKAETLEEKISALEEMLAKVPKHKGTEKIQADIKSKLAKCRKQAESKGGGPARRAESYHIPREGAGRVVMVGEPNTGKSRLFTALTGAVSEAQDYPFTTRRPVPGMMLFEDIQVQVIDLPAVSGQFMESWVPQIIRLADIALLVIDISSLDPVKQLREPVELLRGKKVELVPAREEIGEEESGAHASIARLRTIVAAGFMDVEGAADMLELVRSEPGPEFDLVPVSALGGSGLDGLRRVLFRELRIDRVYSKQPGKKPSPEPFVLKKGSTVMDFAAKVHKDFVENFDFARVWRKGDEKEGVRVSRDYILVDGDIVELHA